MSTSRQKSALLLLIFLSAVEFFLILRHKSPYTSDSRFYQHIVYSFQGNSYGQSQDKVLSGLNPDQLDLVSKNFFYNPLAYEKSLRFFTKRPVYPLTVAILNKIGLSESVSFIIPLVIAYLGTIIVAFTLMAAGLKPFPALVATSLLVAFRPFLEWSTYFQPDVIGSFLWLLMIRELYRYIFQTENSRLKYYVAILVISLFIKEQSLLMIIAAAIIWLFSQKPAAFRAFLVTSIIGTTYISVSIITNQATLFDTIKYLQNGYGLTDNSYTVIQTLSFMAKEILAAHRLLILDLGRHRWWLTIFILGIIGCCRRLCRPKKIKNIDLLFFASGISSYVAIFLYPSFSYKYFFPAVISLIYLAVKFMAKSLSPPTVSSSPKPRRRIPASPLPTPS